MDIEGYECKALLGSKTLIKKNPKLKIVVCTYHNQEDEQAIRDLFNDYYMENSMGYMLFLWD